MFGAARRLLEAGLAGRGYALRQTDRPPRGFAEFLAAYCRAAPAPRTVFDIGVGPGTDWLYDAFPHAKLILFEPLTQFRPDIEKILARRDAVCHWCALAEQDAEMTLHVPTAVPTGSSLLPRDPAWARVQAGMGGGPPSSRRVPVRTLDGMAGDFASPHVVKIDAEGADLRVLQGGRGVVARADLVIVESSVTARNTGGADFIDIAAHMKQAGFVLVDIVDMASYGDPRVLAYIDMAFAPIGGAFLSRVAG